MKITLVSNSRFDEDVYRVHILFFLMLPFQVFFSYYYCLILFYCLFVFFLPSPLNICGLAFVAAKFRSCSGPFLYKHIALLSRWSVTCDHVHMKETQCLDPEVWDKSAFKKKKKKANRVKRKRSLVFLFFLFPDVFSLFVCLQCRGSSACLLLWSLTVKMHLF